MGIIAFNIAKISAQAQPKKTAKVNNSFVLKDAKKTKIQLGSQSQEVLSVSFEFTSSFEPKVGSIELEGNILHMDNPEKIEEITKQWEKEKMLPKAEARIIGNHILSKCQILSIMLSRELNLPTPVELPRLTAK